MFFAARQLKAKRNGGTTEQDLQDYILDWKKSWRAAEKQEAVASAIRNLVMLGWLQVNLSEPLADVAM